MDLCSCRQDLTKKENFPVLGHSGRCKFVVLAIETGGRWIEEAANVFHQLAAARARDVPSYMFKQVALAWERRWTRMLATMVFHCVRGFTCGTHFAV